MNSRFVSRERQRLEPRATGVLAMWILVTSSPAFAQELRVTSHADRAVMRLSDTATVTLSVEGPAPLRVDLPKNLLDEPSSAVWRVRPIGSPTTTPLPDGRAKWQQPFRADSFAPGDSLRLGFAPLKAGSGTDPLRELPIPALEFRVHTSITDPATADIRPVTGIEELPPVPSQTPEYRAALWFGCGILTGVIGFLVWLRLRRRHVRQPPEDVANHVLAKAGEDWTAGRISGAEVAERCESALRNYLEARFAIPATRLTRAELDVAMAQQPWATEAIQKEFQAFLSRSEVLRFAGESRDFSGLSEWVGNCQILLANLISLHAAPPSPQTQA